MVSCAPGRPMTLITDKLSGDKTGWIVVENFHDVYVGVTVVRPPSAELETNVLIKTGGTLSLPPKLIISRKVQVTVGGSLVGVSELTVAEESMLTLQFPGHTGYRKTPQNGLSTLSFKFLLVKHSGRIKTEAQNKVKIAIDYLQVDYQGVVDSTIPVTAKESNLHKLARPLGRSDCPHGFELIATASPKLYNPCETGKHIWKKSNESYIVQVNVSYSVTKIAFRNVIVEGVQTRQTYIDTEIRYKIVDETRFNITYYIACDFTNFTLLPGQECTFNHGGYSYENLEIQGGARMKLQPGTARDQKSILRVSKLKVLTGAKIIANTANFENPVSVSSGRGGSYGGYGGGAMNELAIYGDLAIANDYGSNGGGDVRYRGGAGGVVHIVAKEFINDGTVAANGGDGTAGAGGGSGGSVFVTTSAIRGYGVFMARGGKATSFGNGGGGGRVSIHVTESKSNFHGSYDVSGGDGRLKGSPGTVLIRDKQIQSFYDTLVLQQAGGSPSVLPNSSSIHTFDELQVIKAATFMVNVNELRTKKIVTDGSGKIIVLSGNRIVVDDISDSQKRLKCDLEVRPGGSFISYSRIRFSGPGNLCVVNGGLIQALEVVVRSSRSMQVSDSGELRCSSITLETNTVLVVGEHASIRPSSSGTQFQLNSLTALSGAKVSFNGSNVTLLADTIIFSKNVSVSSRAAIKFLNISANTMIIDSEAKVTVSEGGLTQGPGSSINPNSGSGHGGQGGGLQGGAAYGSVFDPRHYGSGNTVRGGGIIHLNVKTTLTLYGHVKSNGGSGAAGGASGGSVLVYAETLQGHGTIQCNGGNGKHLVGGGSGGRIAVYAADQVGFAGEMTAYGGCIGPCGAAGTVFTQKIVVGLPQNTTIVDNNGQITEAKTKIMHEKKQSYTMRMLKLVKGARLEVASVQNAEMKIAIQQLEGDGSGSFYVHANQTLSLGASKAVTTRPFIFPWAVIVDEGAELLLSPKLFITRYGKLLKTAAIQLLLCSFRIMVFAWGNYPFHVVFVWVQSLARFYFVSVLTTYNTCYYIHILSHIFSLLWCSYAPTLIYATFPQ